MVRRPPSHRQRLDKVAWQAEAALRACQALFAGQSLRAVALWLEDGIWEVVHRVGAAA